jgi:Uma2 family endonuclease
MVMALADLFWTVERVHALPDDVNRYECIDGVLLVTPSPGRPHQHVLAELNDHVRAYVKRHRLGQTVFAPADVIFSDVRLLQPDLLVERGDSSQQAPDLLLVVEVLSKATQHRDCGLKRRVYQQERVSEYWVVDDVARAIECWLPDADEPTRHAETLAWHPAGASAPLVIDVAALFRAALDHDG